MNRKETVLLLLSDAAVAVGAIVGVVLMAPFGVKMLMYYTVLSNILGAAACLVEAAFLVRLLVKGACIPRGVTLFKYASVGCLLLTFLVVVTVLGPTAGDYFSMFSGAMLYHHLLCPLGAFGSFALLPQEEPLGKASVLLGMIPTLLYGIPAIILNILNVWRGPYPFLLVYDQPVWASCLWFVAVFGANALVLLGTKCLYNKLCK